MPSARTSPPRTSGFVLVGALVTVSAGLLAWLILYVVRTDAGQRLDEQVRWGTTVSESTYGLLMRGLTLVSERNILIVMAVLFILGLLLRRFTAAVSGIIVIAGANVITQLLKYALIDRPALAFPGENSLPSGHVTVLCSLACAVLLAAPRRARIVLTAGTAMVSQFAGLAVIVNSWHRPSDILAAYAVCALWVGLVLAIALVTGRGLAEDGNHPGWARFGLYLSVALGAVALVVTWLIVTGLGVTQMWGQARWGIAAVTSVSVCSALLAASVALAGDHLGGRWTRR